MSTSDEKSEQQARAVPTGSGGSAPAQRRPNRRALRIVLAVVGVAVVGGLVYGVLGPAGAGGDATSIQTVAVKRGDLAITVTEGGALRAMESLEIKNKAESGDRRTIVELVDEGTVITEEDVEAGLVLVRLDASDLEEREGSREISFINADAAYTKAEESLAIQRKQNDSDIAIATLNVKFARMALEHHLGAELAGQVIEEKLDFTDLGDNPVLGGLAQQGLRTRQAAVQLAAEELSRAEEELRWSKELVEKGYINRNELTADQLGVTRGTIDLEKSQEDLRLFKRYSLAKDAEQLYSDHVESKRSLARVEARARSQLAQAEAELKSSRLSLDLDRERLQEVKDDLERCVITAPRPGQIVYPGTSNPWHRRRIREGERVWHNQTILTIPDLATLSARVNIHETDIERVKVGQAALVSVEALPGEFFNGKVAKLSPVASAAQAWLNPDIKVYECDISLDEVPEGLTPGMSATAEIIMAELKDVLYIPIEAVTTAGGQRVCWAKGPGGPEVRNIETGHFTEKFVEIKSGLSEGDLVYLEPVERLPDRETHETDRTRRLEQLAATVAAEQPEQQKPEEPETPGVPQTEPTQAEEPPSQPKADEQGESEYMIGGQVNWQKIGQEMRDLSDEERAEKWQEILSKLPAEQRKQLEEQGRQWAQSGGAGGD